VKQLFLAFAVLVTMAACSSGAGSEWHGPILMSPGPISVNPSSLSWALGGYPTPAAVTVTDMKGFGTPPSGNPQVIGVAISDPVHMGAWAVQPAPGATTTTVYVQPIGATNNVTITVNDLMQDEGIVTASSQACGRPDLLSFAQLLAPANGATNVPTTTSTIYVAGTTVPAVTLPPNSAPPGKLHFVIDKIATEEGTTLAAASPPPNSATPAPVPGNTYIGAEPMPSLAPSTTYDVYLYDDACEQPFLAGSFST
jgi:hypothetical protein